MITTESVAAALRAAEEAMGGGNQVAVVLVAAHRKPGPDGVVMTRMSNCGTPAADFLLRKAIEDVDPAEMAPLGDPAGDKRTHPEAARSPSVQQNLRSIAGGFATSAQEVLTAMAAAGMVEPGVGVFILLMPQAQSHGPQVLRCEVAAASSGAPVALLREVLKVLGKVGPHGDQEDPIVVYLGQDGDEPTGEAS